MSQSGPEPRGEVHIAYSSSREATLTRNAELVIGVLFGVLIAQAISPVLAFIASLSVMFTVIGIALIERQRLEWALDQVTVNWDIPPQVRRGESALITLELTNAAPLDLWSVEIAVRTPEGLSLEVRRDLPAHSRGKVSGSLRCPHYASGHVWGVELRAYDSMKLVSAERHLSSIQSLEVIPAPPRLPWRSLDLGQSKSISSAPSQRVYRRRGQDGDFCELRSYQPGDGMRAIAWRPSARRGQLLTRVVERTAERRYLFALDLSSVMRTSLGPVTRVDLALDLISGWIPQLRGEQVGVIGFDHRVLFDLPIAPQARVQRSLGDLSRYASRPLDHDCAIDTPDELWARVMHYLEWSGQAISHKLSEGLLRDLYETRLTSSLLTQSSYRLDFASAYLHHFNFPHPFPSHPIDELPTHDRLRRFCQIIGVTMTSRSSRTAQELSQGLQEAMRYAQEQRATHLVFLSHTHRLSNHREMRLLTHWAREAGVLSWVQLGADDRGMPKVFHKLNAPIHYRPLYKSALQEIEPPDHDAGPWRWRSTL